ncbi:unnamed protein product [Phaeothamnion confervicola]
MSVSVAATRAATLETNTSGIGASHASWRGKSIVSVDQFGKEALETLFAVADEMKRLVREKGGDQRLQGRLLATLFYENSTRTSCSFQAAMLRLGGGIVAVSESTSSVKKGETLEDTIACLHSYCDVVALRHPVEGAAAAAASCGARPVFNAGDGVGEHPTQALLDLYTIRSELGNSVDGKTVAMLGDLKNGRTVHSLAKLLALFACDIRYVSPEPLRMPTKVMERVSRGAGVARQREHRSYDENTRTGDSGDGDANGDGGRTVLAATDVLYVTRIQKERFADPAEYDAVKDAYVITPDVLARCKPRMAVLHPLPRVGEIDAACDADPRAAYFRQMENGMFVRMALLALALGATGQP